MIEKREVVFILGAGASEVYGLPSSSALIAAAQSDRSESLRLALQPFFRREVESRLADFQECVEMAKPFSIDRFLETQSEEDRKIGKALISHALIKSQTMDRLYGRTKNDHVDRYQQDDWVRYLLEYMKADSYEEFLANTVKFITFNYDRSLDTLLANALVARYRSVGLEAAMSKIQGCITHLYGTVGTYFHDRQDAVPDTSCIAGAIRGGTQQIRIISEGEDVSRVREFRIAHKWLSEADLIVFLGFGFDSRNVKRLQLDEHVKKGAKFIGTVLSREGAEVEHDVLGGFHASIRERVAEGLHDLSNVTLLRRYRDLFT